MDQEADRGSFSAKQFTVALICALSEELTACRTMLDQEFDGLQAEEDDPNIYIPGRIKDHFVIVACLPAKKTGTDSAAAVAVAIQRSFKSIRFGLMVGVGGGVPTSDTDIRLGDVVVSQPEGDHGGVVYHDRGKVTETGFVGKRHLNKPPDILLNALNLTKSNHDMQKSRLSEFLGLFDEHRRQVGFARPDLRDSTNLAAQDRLFRKGEEVRREPRAFESSYPQLGPKIHYGLIASGNKIIKNESFRDGLIIDGIRVLCVETEAAGLMDRFPCLVIRGVSDYADSYKNDIWQRWAAACAAAYAKELLMVIPAKEVKELQSTQGLLSETSPCLQVSW